MENSPRKSLKMVACPSCSAKQFIPGDLAPLEKMACTKCGQWVMMPMMLRQYELRAEIASGGMGTVYRSWDTALHREVAVKLMRREFAEDEAAVNNFAVEARACAQVNHTNIIHIYSFDYHEGLRFLAMELADAGSLDSRIEKAVTLPELDVLDIGIKVAGALQAALKRGLLHLDIKPGNILFSTDGEPKLVDFGLAKKADAENDAYAPIFGTPYYIAPERVRQEGDTFLCDIYSLAGTLYHALTGHVPFEAPTVEDVVAAHLAIPLKPACDVNPAVSRPTCDALSKAMAKNPGDRWRSYDEFIMALTAARSQVLIRQFTGREPDSPAAPAVEAVSQIGTTVRSWWRR
jgi:eukaryotic-like serine/threonine-protein kinase